MNSRHKNLAVAALLIAIFAIPAMHLASENEELAEKLDEIKAGKEFRNTRQKPSGGRTVSGRKKTVGRLFQQGPAINDARTLLRTYSLERENSNRFRQWKLHFQLNQMPLDELRALRAELRKLPRFEKYSFKHLETMISFAEIAGAPDDPGIYFDGVIKVARFDRQHSAKLKEWATTDPNAAIAWFQSKSTARDFRNGSIADRENRALALKSLLEGIATQDLDLAVELFSKETRKTERVKAGEVVIPLAIKQAIEQDDDRLLRKVLETAVHSPFSMGSGDPWFDYTKATGDPGKSAKLLKSLENQHDFGRKMATIISVQDEMPYREKVGWLIEQITDREERLQALQVSIETKVAHDPFNNGSGILDEMLAQPPGDNRDLELLAAVHALEYSGQPDRSRRITESISDPDLKARAEAIQVKDPFGANKD